jgi:2Fe-2S type ferredoxin
MGLRSRLKRAIQGPEARGENSRPTSASTKSYAGKRGRKWDEHDLDDFDDDLENEPRARRRSQSPNSASAVLDDGFFDAFDKPKQVAKPLWTPPQAEAVVADETTTFKLHLYNEIEKLDIEIDCFEGETVLDAAERNQIELPYSCLNGGCFMCAAMLDKGDAEMGDQFMLDEKHAAAGFRLLCCTTVSSDCEILTHQNDRLDF